MPEPSPFNDPQTKLFLDRYGEVLMKWADVYSKFEYHRKQVAELEPQLDAANAEYAEVVRSALVFGVQVESLWRERLAASQAAQAEQTNEIPALPQATPTEVRTEDEKTIKERILAMAEAVYPNPVRASALQKQLEEAGIKVHEKTVGMTLYRLSKKPGSMRREGWDWYFVPPLDRQVRLVGGEEGSGADPELQLDGNE